MSRPLLAFAVAGLPTTNRGVSGSDSGVARTFVGVDWVAASVDLGAVLAGQGEPLSWEVLSDVNGYGFQTASVASAIFCQFFADSCIKLDPEQRRGTFYKWRHHLVLANGEKVGQIEFGGVHTMRADGTPTARVELTATGCRAYEADAGGDHAERWSRLQAQLASVGGELTRVDLAFDDLDGVFNIAHALKLWLSGAFDARGQTPECQRVESMKGLKGDTLYIGSRTSEKFMRVYDKGKEQGDEASPWVRWEIQFKRSTRKNLDLAMLTNPADYMRGAYAALHFISEVARRLDVTNEAARATLKSALRHFRRQYGNAVHFLIHATPDHEALGQFIADNLRGRKLPKWAGEYLDAGAACSLLDAMRSPCELVRPATDFETEELCHAR